MIPSQCYCGAVRYLHTNHLLKLSQTFATVLETQYLSQKISHSHIDRH